MCARVGSEGYAPMSRTTSRESTGNIYPVKTMFRQLTGRICRLLYTKMTNCLRKTPLNTYNSCILRIFKFYINAPDYHSSRARIMYLTYLYRLYRKGEQQMKKMVSCGRKRPGSYVILSRYTLKTRYVGNFFRTYLYSLYSLYNKLIKN